jgi:hypothetical protein
LSFTKHSKIDSQRCIPAWLLRFPKPKKMHLRERRENYGKRK